MIPSYAFVYTTTGWDDFTQAQYDRNVGRCRSGDSFIVVDETNGPVPTPAAYIKTSATRELVEELGLRVAYDRALFWHNLDYMYYLVFREHSQYDYYVFMDYDAFIDADVDEIVGRVHAEGIDHVGAPVRDGMTDWVYARQHRAIYGTQLEKGAILSVTILSKRALQHLFARRLEMSRSLSAHGFWPFCEAFIATELKMAGYKRADLGAFGCVEHFAWWPPTLDTDLTPSSGPTFVHPVLDQPRYLASMTKHSPTREFLLPTSRLWRAIAKHPDKRWLPLLLGQMRERVLRRMPVRFKSAPRQDSVGMQWS